MNGLIWMLSSSGLRKVSEEDVSEAWVSEAYSALTTHKITK